MTARQNEGERLVAALTAAGFTVAGRGRGYVRLRLAGTTDRGWTLVVPVDDAFSDY